MFSCALWYYESYQIYTSVLLLVTFVYLIFDIYENINNMRKIQKISYYEAEVAVFRRQTRNTLTLENIKNNIKKISSFNLVPGDVIEVSDNETITCDLILLNGKI